jgi:hypothetical protein
MDTLFLNLLIAEESARTLYGAEGSVSERVNGSVERQLQLEFRLSGEVSKPKRAVRFFH